MAALWDEFSDEELEAVRAFLSKSLALSVTFTEEIRRGGPEARKSVAASPGARRGTR
jgi:hypothetical protein